MNYLPFAGYWFYGGTSATETASYFASWGLLGSAPITSIARYYGRFISGLRNLNAGIF